MIDARLRQLVRAHEADPSPVTACDVAEETLRIGAWPPADLCCLGAWLARAERRGYDLALRGWCETVAARLVTHAMPGCSLVLRPAEAWQNPTFHAAMIMGRNARQLVAYIRRWGAHHQSDAVVMLPPTHADPYSDRGRRPREPFGRTIGHLFDPWGGCARLTAREFAYPPVHEPDLVADGRPVVRRVGGDDATRAARRAVMAGESPVGQQGINARARRTARRARA